MTEHFDMIVIGAGPAGEKAGAQAAYFGHRVAIVERSDLLGGALTESALTTKAMREAALYLTGFQRRDLYRAAIDLEPQGVIDRLRARAATVARVMSEAVHENLERHGIELVRGDAVLREGPGVIVTSDERAPRRLEAPVVLIATGSSPFHPPGVPFEDPDVLDSETARGLDRPVTSLVVVGGGAVACEYASIFIALGSEVTLVDRGERVLPFLDVECSRAIERSFASAGMVLKPSTSIESVGRDRDGLVLRTSDGGSLRPDKVIFAAGRTGNTFGLGLEECRVEVDARGRIVVDDQFQTSAPGVFAAGDVIGPPALASASMEQGRVAACYALGIDFKSTVDPLIPFGVYSIPECAMVGMTEEEAGAAGHAVVSGIGLFAANSRAAIAGTTDGFVKIVVDRDDRRVLGIHVVGEGATELIHQGQAVLHFGGTVDYFIHSTFDVPTMSDAYKYAAYACLQALAWNASA